MFSSDVLLPRNCVRGWSSERLPPRGLPTGKYHSVVLSVIRAPLVYTSLSQVTALTFLASHLKVLFADAASFTQALHDGFVPQDVLLAEVLSPFP